MWYETKNGNWVNEHGIRLMSKTEENICAEVVGHCLEHELTGRISPVPFPGKFVEVKNINECISCYGTGRAELRLPTGPREIPCPNCNGTGKVEDV